MRTGTGAGWCLAFGLALFACKNEGESPGTPGEGPGAEKSAAAVTKKSIDPSTVATVKGVVTFDGALPAPTMIKVSSDAACTKTHPDEFDAGDVKVADKKVENAFVWVKSGLEGYAFPPAEGVVKVDQSGC